MAKTSVLLKCNTAYLCTLQLACIYIYMGDWNLFRLRVYHKNAGRPRKASPEAFGVIIVVSIIIILTIIINPQVRSGLCRALLDRAGPRLTAKGLAGRAASSGGGSSAGGFWRGVRGGGLEGTRHGPRKFQVRFYLINIEFKREYRDYILNFDVEFKL